MQLITKVPALGSKMQTDLTLRLPRQDEEEFMRADRATSPEVPKREKSCGSY